MKVLNCNNIIIVINSTIIIFVPSSSCFISHIGVFFGVFMGPILLMVVFNLIVFIMILRILIRHSYLKLKKTKQDRKVKGIVKTLISLFSITAMFGLQWLFGALTIADASLAFQWLFVIFCTLQGFFLFFFFVIVGEDARDEWLKLINIGKKRRSVFSQSLFSTRSSKGNTNTLSSSLSQEGCYTRQNVILNTPVNSLSPKMSTVDEPIYRVIETESTFMVNQHVANGEGESGERKGSPDIQVPPDILECKSDPSQSDKSLAYPSPPASPVDKEQLPGENGKISPPILRNPENSHSNHDEMTYL